MIKLLILLAICAVARSQTAVFPAAVVTDRQLLIAVDNLQTNVTANVLPADTSISVASTTGFVPNMAVTFSDGNEIAIVCAVPSINRLTIGFNGICPSVVGRGFNGTTASNHALGAAVAAFYVAWHRNSDRVEIEAIENALGPNLIHVNGTGSINGLGPLAPPAIVTAVGPTLVQTPNASAQIDSGGDISTSTSVGPVRPIGIGGALAVTAPGNQAVTFIAGQNGAPSGGTVYTPADINGGFVYMGVNRTACGAPYQSWALGNAAVTFGTTAYYAPAFGTAGTTPLSRVWVVNGPVGAFAGTLTCFTITIGNTAQTNNTMTCTVLANGTTTALTVTIPNGATYNAMDPTTYTFQDTTDTLSLIGGELLGVQCVQAVGSTSASLTSAAVSLE